MNFFAINTADRLEILLVHNGKSLYYCADDKTLASVELLSQIHEMVSKAGVSLNDLDFFAAVTGPGSFTGIRIGVTTINTLSYALNIPAVSISLFDYMAHGYEKPLSVAISDTGNVCYIKNFSSDSSVFEPICIRNEGVSELACSKIVASSSFLPHDKRIEVFSPSKEIFAEVAILSFNQSDKTIARLLPVYLRRAQAERTGDEL